MNARQRAWILFLTIFFMTAASNLDLLIILSTSFLGLLYIFMINIRIFGKNQIRMAYTIQHKFNYNVNIFFLSAFIVFLKTNQIYFPGHWLKSINQNMIQRCEICKVTTSRCIQFSVWFYCSFFLDFKKCRLKII